MRILAVVILAAFTLLIIRVNVKLYPQESTETEIKVDIVKQLNFIENELKNEDLGDRMQKLFPEGLIFVNALYGLAWCELAGTEIEDTLKTRAIKEAVYAFDQINSQKAKNYFPLYLQPEYGIFYNGWSNYLLSKIFIVSNDFPEANRLRHYFLEQSDSIALAIQMSSTPYLQSYNQLSWPADTYVAMASLANYDKAFAPKYQNLIKGWLGRSEELVDSSTKMIPHQVNYQNGTPIQGPRGCSMVLILRMLKEIYQEFANDQYAKLKEQFVSSAVGLPAVREYPDGEFGLGDVDSGPVILGVGFSATITSIGLFSMFGDYELSHAQYQTVHAFGLDIESKDSKQYLLGQLPMADAFIAWGRATALNYKHKDSDTSKVSFVTFHLISFLTLIILWLILYRKSLISIIRK
ncbi:hypothetical protein [Fulvivirga ligni]|uniref:hypothetical protein n=1 Tax=Fulvivirga ligni TaxID=2904246 RepID=UPI001F1DB174|nr:hypothetical protein [Fulvivirga ligni]UII19660.1 hypothetical protein LVD16_17610 [Fulvivirga ligni]